MSTCVSSFCRQMPTTIKELKPIPEHPPRWKPSSDPASITVAGLGTTGSVNDQIDQIDQLITLKLQVSIELSNVFCLSRFPARACYCRTSMPTFPRCNKFSRTGSCLLLSDTRTVLSRRAKRPRYVCVCTHPDTFRTYQLPPPPPVLDILL